MAGLTSTEFVRVGDRILDYGDYSGPGGARMLLRDNALEIAYLEVARGGILRRGLPLRTARAALVTNVAADHLGDYGVNTVEDLAIAKFAVHRTLGKNGVLVLNADDAYVVAQTKNTELENGVRICWFSLDAENTNIVLARKNHQPCGWLAGAELIFFDGTIAQPVIDITDIPITMGGLARYNVENALGAVCLSRAMGLSDQAIHAGLSNFKNNASDNPGRCNEFAVNGARVFVDFAHNLHSVSALVSTLKNIPAKRVFILLSHAGDRSDNDMQAVTKALFALKPDYIFPAEIEHYLRGRELGEVSQITRDECMKNGLPPEQIICVPTPTSGAQNIMQRLRSGDMALMLVLSEREKVFALLDEFQVS